MHIIIYDFGTSSVKTCLFEIGSEIRFVAGSSAGYGLYIYDDEALALLFGDAFKDVFRAD